MKAVSGALRPRRRLLSVLYAGGLATYTLTSGPNVQSQSRSLTIQSSDIPSFAAGAKTVRFGKLDYVGGFQYSSSDGRLSGVSGIRLQEGRSRFLAVTDTGYWFRGRIARDPQGRPTGFDDAEMAPILGADGQSRTRRKGLADAEGLALDGDRAVVSFERYHRIESFPNAADPTDSRPTEIRQPIPRRELRTNAGIEAIAVSKAGPGRAKRTVIVTEQSIDAEGNLFAAILGPEGGLFKVKREEPWSVTDAAFLPGGDLLLLERRYQSFGRVGMRIRRISGAAIRPGAIVDGEVLIDADLGEEIDNMEGIDVATGPDGATTIALVSDDNGNFLQRNLYLEFRLVEDAAQSSVVTDDGASTVH